MRSNPQATVQFTDADWSAYAALTPKDRPAFLVAKLAAQFSVQLLGSLANNSVWMVLSTEDRAAISVLITAIKGSPNA